MAIKQGIIIEYQHISTPTIQYLTLASVAYQMLAADNSLAILQNSLKT